MKIRVLLALSGLVLAHTAAFALTPEETASLLASAEKRKASELLSKYFQRMYPDDPIGKQCENFFHAHRRDLPNTPVSECMDYLTKAIASWREFEVRDAAQKREEAALAELAAQKRDADAEKNKPMSESEKAARVAALKGGAIKPETLLDWRTVTGATDGSTTATSPKLKPDGKVYMMTGIVESIDANGGFVVTFSYGGFPLVIQQTQNPRLTGSDYFHVSTSSRFNGIELGDIAVGKGVDIVGTYRSNLSYKTVGGQVKSMPSFVPTFIGRWTSSYQGAGL